LIACPATRNLPCKPLPFPPVRPPDRPHRAEEASF
jgi:hypothetical protein